MNRRLAVPVGLSVAALIALGVVIKQQLKHSTLQRELARLHQQIVTSAHISSTEAPLLATTATTTPPLTPEEKLELMQLRNRVTDLRERQRALAGASNQTAALRVQLAAVSNQDFGQVPPGYILRKDLQYLGAATPEAALQSYFWALEHKDTNVLLSLVPIEEAANLAQRWENDGGPAEFFKRTGTLPGLRITGRTNQGPDVVELQMEVLPGTSEPTRLHRIAGTWRLGD